MRIEAVRGGDIVRVRGSLGLVQAVEHRPRRHRRLRVHLDGGPRWVSGREVERWWKRMRVR